MPHPTLPLTLLLLACLSSAQAGGVSASEPETKAKTEAATVAVGEPVDGWEFSGLLTGYAVPDGPDYLSTTFTADRGPLHLEARHNYEALDTASLWLGWNGHWEGFFEIELTPMVAAVLGQVRGVAPGWRLAIRRGRWEWTSEAEFLFDADDSESNFFYAWSELTWSPADWLWFGLALQRTRTYETSLDVQRGVVLGFSWKDLTVSGYVFNWGFDDPTFIVGLGLDF